MFGFRDRVGVRGRIEGVWAPVGLSDVMEPGGEAYGGHLGGFQLELAGEVRCVVANPCAVVAPRIMAVDEISDTEGGGQLDRCGGVFAQLFSIDDALFAGHRHLEGALGQQAK
jgi:hypothetical protein